MPSTESSPLKSLASISTPDPKTIAIQPWEASIVPEVEKAIMKSDLGLTPSNDGQVVRINIPALTEERRNELSRLVRKVAEEGRVSVRSARHDGIELVKKHEKEKALTEDDLHLLQKEIQKLTDDFSKQIDEALENKCIFENLDNLIESLHNFIQGSFAEFGDCASIRHAIDPFDDARTGERISNFLLSYLNELRIQQDREKSILNALKVFPKVS